MSLSAILKINQEYNKRSKRLFAGNNARDLGHFRANCDRNLEDNNVMDLFYLLQDGLNLYEPVIPQGCAAVIQNGANPAALTAERKKKKLSFPFYECDYLIINFPGQIKWLILTMTIHCGNTIHTLALLKLHCWQPLLNISMHQLNSRGNNKMFTKNFYIHSKSQQYT
jgi:hypothetical protein